MTNKYAIENLPNKRFENRVKQILTDIKDIDKATNIIVGILQDVINEEREENKSWILNEDTSKQEKNKWKSKDLVYIHIQQLINKPSLSSY